MVSRFLETDRDRQNRLEDRLDHLFQVVQATVANQSPEKDQVPSAPQLIKNLDPPPRPGAQNPPKLDLVPPKPVRLPSRLNFDLLNQNVQQTRPGVVSPVMSPEKVRPGPIWSKLGPVSQSPFVRAQQELGFQVKLPAESRMQSSAERRIAREVENEISPERAKLETAAFILHEKKTEENVENARVQSILEQDLIAKQKLLTQREPSAAMILSAAFIESEFQLFLKMPSILEL